MLETRLYYHDAGIKYIRSNTNNLKVYYKTKMTFQLNTFYSDSNVENVNWKTNHKLDIQVNYLTLHDINIGALFSMESG